MLFAKLMQHPHSEKPMPAFSADIKPDSLVDSIKIRLQKLIFHTETFRELKLIHHFSASQSVGLNLLRD